MLTKAEIVQKALQLGFDEIGFTSAELFESQYQVLMERREAYAHLLTGGFNLLSATDPRSIMPEARSIIVLIHGYLKETFDPAMEAHFGRLYIDEDRILQQQMAGRAREFVLYLRDAGIQAKESAELPQRVCARRAGIGSVGKNCLLFAGEAGGENSWVIPTTILVDQEFAPDPPADESDYGCPDWCRNACIVACPTRALKGPRNIDPRLCIAQLTYGSDAITPTEMREAMGLWVYGCDRCQDVCPRNDAWRTRDKAVNPRVAAKAPDFELTQLLHMDVEFFKARIWPHMFYTPPEKLWLWKMNVARVMGNTRDRKYVPELIRAFRENGDERVQGMIAWSLGRLGGEAAKTSLNEFVGGSEGLVAREIHQALTMF